MWCSLFGVWGLGFGVWGLGFMVWGLGFIVLCVTLLQLTETGRTGHRICSSLGCRCSACACVHEEFVCWDSLACFDVCCFWVGKRCGHCIMFVYTRSHTHVHKNITHTRIHMHIILHTLAYTCIHIPIHMYTLYCRSDSTVKRQLCLPRLHRRLV